MLSYPRKRYEKLKKVLSVCLALVLSVGMVPSTVQAGMATGGPGNFPDELKGLNYALYTGDNSGIFISAFNTYINGDVHSNSDFTYSGMEFEVTGKLETSGNVVVNTMPNGEIIGDKLQKQPIIQTPDLTAELYNYIEKDAVKYPDGMIFGQENIDLSKPVYIDGSMTSQYSQLDGSGIVYAKNDLTFQGDKINTVSGSSVFLCSERGNITLVGNDIELNGVIYAPYGTVSVNAHNFNLNGRIIANRVVFSTSNITINSGENDYDVIDGMFRPEADLTVEGNLKENRKVVLNVTGPAILPELTQWTITKTDGADAGSILYQIDNSNSTDIKKEMIFKKAGEYLIQANVSDGSKDNLVEQTVIIDVDQEPVANFSMKNEAFRNASGSAVLSVTDQSYSRDGDSIAKRIYTLYHDANNDGKFTEDEGQIISSGNATQLDYKITTVGNFKLELKVQETFTDTIPSLLTDSDYRTGNTSQKAAEEKEFAIGNKAPVAKLDVHKAKAADIVFTVGTADTAKVNQLSEKVKELEKIMKDNEVDARISTVSTSKLTAQDTFAWQEFDHYNYADRYLPTLPKHILYQGKDIKMVGYSVAPLKDFCYIADEDANQKIFNFDLQRDGTDWHSMEGGGFLFNTMVSATNNRIGGYCILVTQKGLKLVEIQNVNLANFRNGSYAQVEKAGRLLKTFAFSNPYANHHLKIVADSKTISIWDGDSQIVKDFTLPSNYYGNGYGPIISHASHACKQQSYFTFKNITMETVSGEKLADVMNDYKWRDGVARFVVNLSEEPVSELTTDKDVSNMAKVLIEKDIHFTGIGNSKNEAQYNKLIKTAQTGGSFMKADDVDAVMDVLNQEMLKIVNDKNYDIEKYISTDDRVDYIHYYTDPENDPIYQGEWEYTYDAGVFGENNTGKPIVSIVKEPILQFTKTGEYDIRLKVRDNPVGNNNALDSYRKWSEIAESTKTLVVQSRPIAELAANVSADTTDSSKYNVVLTQGGYDPDHKTEADKGIVSVKYSYKNLNDSQWTDGKLPQKVNAGQIYLVKAVLTDKEGTISYPAVAIVNTGVK